jgi:hypothetical protein
MTSKRKNQGTGADRLAQAFATLTHRGSGGELKTPTVTELCRLASVSRNSLYRYHKGLLSSLRQYQRGHHRAGDSKVSGKNKKLSSENTSLRKKLTKIAALVDHYYLAHREASGLLERRERELAELRRSLKLQPIPLSR